MRGVGWNRAQGVLTECRVVSRSRRRRGREWSFYGKGNNPRKMDVGKDQGTNVGSIHLYTPGRSGRRYRHTGGLERRERPVVSALQVHYLNWIRHSG